MPDEQISSIQANIDVCDWSMKHGALRLILANVAELRRSLFYNSHFARRQLAHPNDSVSPDAQTATPRPGSTRCASTAHC